ncbi:MAG: hypothetical protein H0V29_03915 [Thermoleophilaceae bacterium]|nr:hypothetical protein [Thermoleophilaceae bacterium]
MEWTDAFIAAQGNRTIPELAQITGIGERVLARYRVGTIPRPAQYERLLPHMPGLLPLPQIRRRAETDPSTDQRVSDLEDAVLSLSEQIGARRGAGRGGQLATESGAMAERQELLERLRVRQRTRRRRADQGPER